MGTDWRPSTQFKCAIVICMLVVLHVIPVVSSQGCSDCIQQVSFGCFHGCPNGTLLLNITESTSIFMGLNIENSLFSKNWTTLVIEGHNHFLQCNQAEIIFEAHIFISGFQSAIIENLFMQYCSTSNDGGALRITNCGSATVINTTLAENTARSGIGGAISFEAVGLVSIIGSNFKINEAQRGGAIALIEVTYTSIVNVVMSHNTATSEGGALLAESTAMAYLEMRNVTVQLSQSVLGSIFLRNQNITISELACNLNTASQYGAGITAFSSTIIMDDSFFGSNLIGFTTDNRNPESPVGIIQTANTYIKMNNVTITLSAMLLIPYAASIVAIQSQGLNFTDCYIMNNTAQAIWVNTSNYPIDFDRVQFRFNVGAEMALNWAAVFVHVDTLSITNSDISENVGGGLYFVGSFAYISNTHIAANKAFPGGGGGLFVLGDAKFRPYVTILNSKFIGNTAFGPGGALHAYEVQSLTINSCVFEHNNASDYGGAIVIRDCNDVILTNTIVQYNTITATDSYLGGGIYCYGDAVSPRVTFQNLKLDSNWNWEGNVINDISCVNCPW